ncbi:MAG: hypothetical protein ACXVQJ_03260 [Actinomycetota bacterium]
MEALRDPARRSCAARDAKDLRRSNRRILAVAGRPRVVWHWSRVWVLG